MGWVVLSSIANVFVVVFQCWPISYNWEVITAANGHHQCLDVNILAIYTAVMGIAQDFTIMVIPLPIIVQLNMPWKKRLMTLCMFSLGSFVVLAACFRLLHILQFSKSSNPTWDYTSPVIWTSLEVKVTVIVLCMPTIRLVIVHIWPAEFSTRKRSSAVKTGSTPKSGTKSSRKNPYDPISGDSVSSGTTPNPWERDIELQEQSPKDDYIQIRQEYREDLQDHREHRQQQQLQRKRSERRHHQQQQQQLQQPQSFDTYRNDQVAPIATVHRSRTTPIAASFIRDRNENDPFYQNNHEWPLAPPPASRPPAPRNPAPRMRTYTSPGVLPPGSSGHGGWI
ncbi:hypothetical protein G7054_g4583 [Neopestalotiopsis clavispora]|nr:hypothetical protein G7054_g4583 [Neopestalotiopsis clavispora]